MKASEKLLGLIHDIQVSGEFTRKEALALLTILVDVVERLERIEQEEATTSRPGVPPPPKGATPP